MGKVWVPLESNPEVVTRFAHELGVESGYGFAEVYSLDLLAIVPRPVYAVILLFPLSDKIVSAAEAREATAGEKADRDDQVFFCKQTISNACGTVALLHSVGNNIDRVPTRPDSFFPRFVNSTKGLTATERANHLEASNELDTAQKHFAQEGETVAPAAEDKLDTHFIAFIHHNAQLYELDGRKPHPVLHGSTTDATLLEDACVVIRDKFMALDPDEVRFTIMALTPTDE